MTSTIYRYEIPVDDQWHPLPLSGAIVHVASRDPYAVELWALDGGPTVTRGFRVFGTGQPLPDDVQHVGTAIPPGGRLVWHLMEMV